MRVLVAAASKHGSTREMAQEIGRILVEQGVEVSQLRPEEVRSVDEYDAVVLGSAVYAGHWMKPARELVDRLAPALANRPTWLFSSGPIGVPAKPDEDPVDVAGVLEITRARDHRVFAGKLEKKGLNFGEKAIVLALHAPEGDFREWDAISAWAETIAHELLRTREGGRDEDPHG